MASRWMLPSISITAAAAAAVTYSSSSRSTAYAEPRLEQLLKPLPSREDLLSGVNKTQYDVLVIGGGSGRTILITPNLLPTNCDFLGQPDVE